jgi:molecular chaperone DnaJ
LSFPTAALGGTVEVPTIDGVAKVKIDPGTQPGKVLRLRNKGLPSVNGFGTGDELVHVNVYVPENLTDKEKKLLSEMEKSPNFEPSKSAKKNVFNKFKKMFD